MTSSSSSSIKDTDGLHGLHRVFISHRAHAATTSILTGLEVDRNHVASDAEHLLNLTLADTVVQLHSDAINSPK